MNYINSAKNNTVIEYGFFKVIAQIYIAYLDFYSLEFSRESLKKFVHYFMYADNVFDEAKKINDDIDLYKFYSKQKEYHYNKKTESSLNLYEVYINNTYKLETKLDKYFKKIHYV